MLNANELIQLTEFRHQLHQSPELSGEETNTASQVATFLQPYKPDHFYDDLSGNAIAAIYDGEEAGPTILFRCELDALPIFETTQVSYKSKQDNIAHSCGHDGHMAIVSSLALKLHEKRPRSGRVILLFQPAEETGKGAKPLVAALQNNNLVPEYSFSLHNMPKLDMHSVNIKDGFFNCASVGMKIELLGRTSHASRPEDGINPSQATCEILAEVKNIIEEYSSHEAYCSISITHVSMGEKSFGVTAGSAEIMLTLRSESDLLLQNMQDRLDIFTQKVSQKYNLNYKHNYDEAFDACINNPETGAKIRQACANLNIPVVEMADASRASEDFGQFANISKSAMFFLGSGIDTPQVHNPDFNFPDELIESGHNIFHQIIKDYLG